jgi:hypothetical protein
LGSGSSGVGAGVGGSGGANACGARGGAFGGGNSCGSGGNGRAGGGAVRIIWPGCARSFPSTRTGNE